ncbi:hypothetical protein D3C81_2307650 [compost metagenome]
MAAGFDATEWQLHTARRAIVVDEDLATAQPLCHAELTAAVTRPDPRNQAELGRIGHLDGFFLGIEGH